MTTEECNRHIEQLKCDLERYKAEGNREWVWRTETKIIWYSQKINECDMVDRSFTTIRKKMFDRRKAIAEYVSEHPDATSVQVAEYFDISQGTASAVMLSLKIEKNGCKD